MLVENLKRELEDLVAVAGYDKVFDRLRGNILLHSDDCQLYLDTIIVEARYNEAKRAGNLNLIDFKEINQNFSSIAQALLWLISRLSLVDLSDKYRQEAESHRTIPTIHALTCNRSVQKQVFDDHYFFEPGPAEKFRFFYLYGDARQEHESLFKRFAYDRNGLINFRWRQKSNGASSKEPLFRHCKPEFSESPRMFEMYILRDLFACFFEPVNEQELNASSKLHDLLKSPDIKLLSPEDHVFVLFTIDDFNWRKEVTPLVVERLFKGLYDCQLPPTAPKFFFFFGLEYSKSNNRVKDEVGEAIQAAKYGTALKQLEPVTLVDIGGWFSRYKEICGGREALEMAGHLFGLQTTHIDMADVEPKLLEIIEKHNKRLLI